MRNTLKYKLTFAVLLYISHASIMKICMNILAQSWHLMSVAEATRHSQLGGVFSLCLSKGYGEVTINPDRQEVSR